MHSLRLFKSALTFKSPVYCRSARFFQTFAPLQQDIIQDLYLKELKSYKPQKRSSSEEDSGVKKWSDPAPPAAPIIESDISSMLKAYDNEPVELKANEGEKAKQHEYKPGDWFEDVGYICKAKKILILQAELSSE